jgi:hypothetical protein
MAVGIVAALGLTVAIVRSMPIREHFLTDADTIKQPVAQARTRDILWQPPRPLSELINTAADDYEPRLSADGMTLFFVRGKAGQNADIYASHATAQGWTEPEALLNVDSAYDDLGPEPSADGTALYFYSDRPGGHGGYDLWVAYLGGSGWRTPVNVGPAVNSEFNDYGPALTPDGGTLYFASNRPGADDVGPSPHAWPATIREDLFHRDYDLYAAAVTERGIAEAAPLDALNTPFNDGAPAVSSFGDFLYFASDRPGGEGGFDLYRGRRLRGALVQVDNLGRVVNTSGNELDPGLSLGGYGLHFSSDRPVDGAAAAEQREYNLYYTTSREVFAEAESRDRPPINWAGIWSTVGPNLLWLLLLLLLLLLFLAALRGMAERRLGLLTKCLLASLFAHLLLLLLLTLWQVTTTLAGQFGRRGPIQVALAPSAQAGELSTQVRGALTDVAAPAFEQRDLERQESELPRAEADALATLSVDSSPLHVTQRETYVQIDAQDARLLDAPDPRTSEGPVTQTATPLPLTPDVPTEAQQSRTAETDLPPPRQEPGETATRPAVTAHPAVEPTSALAQVDVADADPDALRDTLQQSLVGASKPADAMPVPQPVGHVADAAAHADPAAMPELALGVREAPPAQANERPAARLQSEMPRATPRPAPSDVAGPEGVVALVDAAVPPIELAQPDSVAPQVELAALRDSAAGWPSVDAAEAQLEATRTVPPAMVMPDVSIGAVEAETQEQAETAFDPGTGFVKANIEIRAETAPEPRREAPDPYVEPAAPEQLDAGGATSLVGGNAYDVTESAAPPPSMERRTETLDDEVTGIPLPASELALATPKESVTMAAASESDMAAPPTADTPTTRAEPTVRPSEREDNGGEPIAVPPVSVEVPKLDVSLLAAAAGKSPDAHVADLSLPLPANVADSHAAASTPTDLPLTDVLGLPGDELAPDNPYLLRDAENRMTIVERMGGSADTERAVALALAWLARHQDENGHWDGGDFDDDCGQCGGETDIAADTALTGLATLCFLGAGHTHIADGPYRETVQRALRWLAEQEHDGDLRNGETMYSQGIASIAISEALAMTEDAALEGPVRRAMRFIANARHSRAGGWRYDPGQLGDTSVLGWQMMALKSARMGGLYVAPDLFDTGRLWLDTVSRRSRGHYAYTPDRPPTPSMTAEGMFVQQLLGLKRDHPRMAESAAYLMEHLPNWEADPSTYYWYYASLALFQHQGNEWKRWNEALTRELLDHQRTDGGATGSWDPADRWSRLGGRVYQTALCTMMLEVYYRYLPLYALDDAPMASPPEHRPGTIHGRVLDGQTGAPLPDAIVRLDLSGRPSIVATADAQGLYRLDASGVPEHFALSASREGFLPRTMDVESAMLEGGPLAIDFELEPTRGDAVAVEAVPDVHHLGDNRFDGRINSQFQKRSEGASFEAEFALTEQQLAGHASRAELRLMAKGVQRSHRLLINDTDLDDPLDDAPSDGSFGEFVATFDKSLLRAGKNKFAVIAAPSSSDIDDFEFVNVQVRFLP